MTNQDPANDTINLAEWFVPCQPSWWFEVDGNRFDNLVAAEKFAAHTGKPIYCSVKGNAIWQWRKSKKRRAGNE